MMCTFNKPRGMMTPGCEDDTFNKPRVNGE